MGKDRSFKEETNITGYDKKKFDTEKNSFL